MNSYDHIAFLPSYPYGVVSVSLHIVALNVENFRLMSGSVSTSLLIYKENHAENVYMSC